MEAGAVLADEDLRRNGHWRSRPEVQILIEKAGEAARALGRLPETEGALVADMIREERARLRDPDAEYALGPRWPGKDMLVEGDRLRIAYHPDLPDGELVVVAAGLAGGLAPDDELELEWLAPERLRRGPVLDMHAEDLGKATVWRAEWRHGELRSAALVRERPVAAWRGGLFGVSFLPAASPTALKAFRRRVRQWGLQRRSDKGLLDLARMFHREIAGWIGYFGAFYKSALYPTLRLIDAHLQRWAMRKFKRFRQRPRQARLWLARIAKAEPTRFAHWTLLHGQGRALGAV